MKVNSIFSKKKKKRYMFANNKKKNAQNTLYEQKKKKTNSLFNLLYVFEQKSSTINCKIVNCSKLDKHQFLYFHRSFPSSFNSHHPPIFSNWKSTTASTPSKGNVNTLKSYSNDLVSSLQSGLIACPKAEERDFYSLHFYLHPIRVPISFDYWLRNNRYDK